jgi:hypothetical protein
MKQLRIWKLLLPYRNPNDPGRKKTVPPGAFSGKLVNILMKLFLLSGWLIMLFAAVAILLWFNQYQYLRPTPVPAGYRPVASGSGVEWARHGMVSPAKPAFIHFFNPDCPCSRFNIGHVNNLVKRYGKDAEFLVVLVTDKPYTKSVKERFNITVPVIRDPEFAKSCGVYSTPQAVILTPDDKIYFRGNYNRSRYCTDSKTEYARIALEQLLRKAPRVQASRYATTAYGCSLPKCTK